MKPGFRNKRFIRIIILFMIFMVLTGFAYEPILINIPEGSFIDLTGGIDSSLKTADSIYKRNHPTPTPRPAQVQNPTAAAQTPEEKVETVVVVSVSDKIVKIGDMECQSVDELGEMIQEEQYDNKSFLLVDDFAEYKTYKQVLQILKDAGKDFQTEDVLK